MSDIPSEQLPVGSVRRTNGLPPRFPLHTPPLGPGANYLDAFRFAGATAFIGYTLALWQMSIWYRRAWSMTIKSTFDGLIYSLLTAGAFGWLWPR